MPLSLGILSCLGHMFTCEKNKALPFPHTPQKNWVFWYDVSRIIWIGWISHTSFLIVSQLSSCYFLVSELFGNRSHVSQVSLELLCIQGWPWTSDPPAFASYMLAYATGPRFLTLVWVKPGAFPVVNPYQHFSVRDQHLSQHYIYLIQSFHVRYSHGSPHSISEKVKQFFLACFMSEETQLSGNYDSYSAKSYWIWRLYLSNLNIFIPKDQALYAGSSCTFRSWR